MTDPEPLHELLRRRRSTPSLLLAGPPPARAVLERMVSTALRVPDHGRLAPWRILLLEGEPRRTFTEWVMQRRAAQSPPPAPAQLDKERQKLGTAPAILVVIARIDGSSRIPEQEQLLSGACVCFSLLLAAEAEGLGAQWLTGWAAYAPEVAAFLGLAANERILGFIHVGQRQLEAPERQRPALADHFAVWQP